MTEESARKEERALLLISQVYPPDPAAVGQYMADVARVMARRGWQVTVLSADRGYDDPSLHYEREEDLHGVHVHRFSCSSFGKESITIRLMAGFIFVLQCLCFGLVKGKYKAILVSTSPPFAPAGALLLSRLKKAPLIYWVMDINPDQMIRLKLIKSTAIAARLFDWLNKKVLEQAKNIITLDSFMAKTINEKEEVKDKLAVIPPWPLGFYPEQVKQGDNPFQRQYNPDQKLLIMYSGNHSLANPLNTLLEAALDLQEVENILFFFVGGGVNKHEIDDLVKERKPKNIISLPYQPLESLQYSLSAADIQVVSMGDDMVGIVHPSKIYGALAVGKPVIAIGPHHSHVATIVAENRIGWQVRHGDTDGLKELILKITSLPRAELTDMGQRARALAEGVYNRQHLLGKVCDIIEK